MCLAAERTVKPAQISPECKHYSLTSDAPSGKDGAAFMALMAEKARLAALLPEGWSRDMTTFLSLSQEVLLSLLSFCTACSIHGVQTREHGHTSRSPLDSLESAIGFPHARLVAADESKLLRTPEKAADYRCPE